MRKMKKGNANNTGIKLVYLALVFLIAIGLSSGATFSYAKYKIENIVNRPANIALAVVDYERGSLIRNAEKADEYIYSVNDKNIVFPDIEPKDSIEYVFSINNFIEEKGKRQLNEVVMEVELTFKVFLKRLVSSTSSEDEAEDGISYFIIETDYTVEETPDTTNMKGASITFSKKVDNKFDTLDRITSESDYYDTPELGVYVDGTSNTHHYRFFFTPGQDEIQNIFKLNVVLPEQSVDATNTIAGRLHIEIEINAEQAKLI